MATALSQQLAQIAQTSTKQLDLKAQKQRHSKSLLFSPTEAARQSFIQLFDTVCLPAFQDLCALDARFRGYEANLFSPDSVGIEREGLTQEENERLDGLCRSFLGLVQGRLNLAPAPRAVEWLVRRWRLHESDAAALLLTFLPYHGSDLFPVALSIVGSDKLPMTWSWLRPYCGTGHDVPRHAIISALTRTPALSMALHAWTVDCARKGYAARPLLGFWAGVSAQALAAQLDVAVSAREAVNAARTEEVLLRVLPVLDDIFLLCRERKGQDELYLGACIMITVLATKASLSGKLIDGLAVSVASSWSEQVADEGLACIAVLAEEKELGTNLPKVVTKAISRLEDAAARLKILAERTRAENLILSVVTTAIEDEATSSATLSDSVANELLQARILKSESKALLVLRAQRSRGGAQSLALETTLSMPFLESDKQDGSEQISDLMDLDDSTVVAARTPMIDETNLTSALPQLPDELVSFLLPHHSDVFYFYCRTMATLVSSNSGTDHFLSLLNGRGEKALDSPRSLSFLARAISTHNLPLSARMAALRAMRSTVERVMEEGRAFDLQVLLPYLFHALEDHDEQIRKEAASQFALLEKLYHLGGNIDRVLSSTPTLFKEDWYGDQSSKISWLSPADANYFVTGALMPVLEECALDSAYLAKHLRRLVNGEAVSGSGSGKSMKSSLRNAFCTWLASHAAVTTALSVKKALSDMISGVGKCATEARKSVLVPYLRGWTQLPVDESMKQCTKEGLEFKALGNSLFSALSYRSLDELQLLKDTAGAPTTENLAMMPQLSSLAFHRLRQLFSQMKESSQHELAIWLLGLTEDGGTGYLQTEALETLRALVLSAETLRQLIEDLPASANMQIPSEPPAKRRRTSSSHASRNLVVGSVESRFAGAAINRITRVLELVESNRSGNDAVLLKPLFHLLAELAKFKDLLSSELVYPTQILLECLQSVIAAKSKASNDASNDADTAAVRSDLIVDLLRVTSSAQIQTAALRLMSTLASWRPGSILHSIMPLFTFANSGILRRSDSYAAAVADEAIVSLIPALAASLKTNGKHGSMIEGSVDLVLSFVAAWEHVPLHRRIPLFTKVVETLGPDEVLGGVICAMVERYRSGAVIEFSRELMAHFTVHTQVVALVQYMGIVKDALSTKRRLSNLLLVLGEKKPDEIEGSAGFLLQSMADLLKQYTQLQTQLSRKLSKMGDDIEGLRSALGDALEIAMNLAFETAIKPELRMTAERVVAALTALLPTSQLLKSATFLAEKGSPQMHQSLLLTLEQRAGSQTGEKSLDANTFMGAGLEFCKRFVTHANVSLVARHASISCVDTILERFGRTSPSAALSAAEAIAGPHALGENDAGLLTISTLTLATVVEILGEEVAPILPKAIERVLEIIASSTEVEEVLSAGFAFMTAIVDHIPWLLAQSDLESALQLAATSGDTSSAFRSLVSKRVPARTCFSALNNSIALHFERQQQAPQETLRSLVPLIQVFKDAAEASSKKVVAANVQILFEALTHCLDVRRLASSSPDEEDLKVLMGGDVNELAMIIVMKLSDTTFRPFFIRLVEWATTPTGLAATDIKGKMLRHHSLYSFALTLSENLKSLVTSYSSFLLEPTVVVLNSLARDNNADHAEEQTKYELLEVVLHWASSAFANDQDDFWASPAHFTTVSEPLLKLVGKANKFSSPIRDGIPSTIAALAEAVESSQDHLSTINRSLLNHLRSPMSDVRLLAVQAETAVTETLEEDWLVLLPEMLPAISELLEDDSEEVEHEALKWVRNIETISGENLDGMLN